MDLLWSLQSCSEVLMADSPLPHVGPLAIHEAIFYLQLYQFAASSNHMIMFYDPFAKNSSYFCFSAKPIHSKALVLLMTAAKQVVKSGQSCGSPIL